MVNSRFIQSAFLVPYVIQPLALPLLVSEATVMTKRTFAAPTYWQWQWQWQWGWGWRSSECIEVQVVVCHSSTVVS